jgi:hypothetical protein
MHTRAREVTNQFSLLQEERTSCIFASQKPSISEWRIILIGAAPFLLSNGRGNAQAAEMWTKKTG